METVRVPLGEHAYDIEIGAGLLNDAGRRMAEVLRRPRVFVVTDHNVADIHLKPLLASLDQAGIAHEHFVVQAGEGAKSFPVLESLIDVLLERRVERSTTLVALGGGVVGDLTGFASAIVQRGLDFIQIPTTLLSQVDSSVGGKTGINTPRGKNLVGAFHQPRLVLTDTRTLDSLPLRERRAGYAEIVKMALIRDANFFDWLENNGSQVIGGEEAALTYAIAAACTEKARIVAADEKERGLRALLNLGHTFGHALEAEVGFGPALRHGEAVALGILMALDLSVRIGECPAGDQNRVKAHFERVGLPTRLRDIECGSGWKAENLFGHMRHDKKYSDGRVTYVLLRGIGQGFLSRDVEVSKVRETIEASVAA